MTDIPSLQPGQAADAQTIQALINRANQSRHQHVGSTTRVMRPGTASAPVTKEQPFWAVITELSLHKFEPLAYGSFGGYKQKDEFRPKECNEYGWVEVVRQEKEDGKIDWVKKEGGRTSEPQEDEFYAEKNYYLRPAIEVNGRTNLPFNTLIWLVPGRTFFNDAKELIKEYHFSTEHDVQPFELQGTLVAGRVQTEATGDGSDEGTEEAVSEYRVEAQPLQLHADPNDWRNEHIDRDEQSVRLYPASVFFESGHVLTTDADFIESDAPRFSQGICRGVDEYSQGCLAWARWVDKAYVVRHGTDEVFYGQWQIVSIDGSLLSAARVKESVQTPVHDYSIASGASGIVSIWWPPGRPDSPLEASGYEVRAYNDTGATIEAGWLVTIYFDRQKYRWQIIAGSGDAGEPHYAAVEASWEAIGPPYNRRGTASYTVEVKECTYGDPTPTDDTVFEVVTPLKITLDTALYEDSIIEWHYVGGVRVICSDCWGPPIGTVQMWNQLIGNIPKGWRECKAGATSDFTGDGGRFPRHVGADALGAQSGYRYHGGGNIPPVAADNDHGTHDFMTASAMDMLEGATFPATTTVNACTVGGKMDLDWGEFLASRENDGVWDKYMHTQTNNCPPSEAVFFIERFE